MVDDGPRHPYTKAPETRARVQNLLQEHEYVGRRAESVGRMRAEQQMVELVFYGRLRSHSMVILQGVLDAARELGVAVVVSVRPRRLERTKAGRPAAWVRHLTEAGRRAVIDVVDDVREGDLTALSRAHLPLVVIDPLTLPRRQVTSVGATNFAGGLAATEHLLALGHSRLAYLGAEATFPYNQARMHGYRAALEAAGVEPLREMGRVALKTAIQLAEGEQLDSHHVELATELVIRSSTAPPPN